MAFSKISPQEGYGSGGSVGGEVEGSSGRVILGGGILSTSK